MKTRNGLLIIGLITLGGCATGDGNKPVAVTPIGSTPSAASAAPNRPADAIAIVGPLGTSTVHGTVRFYQEGNGLRVRGMIEGLSPGMHGLHIHEKGDCSSPDGSSAGPHFNPAKSTHGGPGSGPHHAGDFGNIEANADGAATFDTVFSQLSLRGESGVIGRSVVVHADPDDLKTQPAGNSGVRIGCGLIQTPF